MKEAELKMLVFEALKRIAPEKDPQQVRADEDLREALDLDSMDFLNFVVELHTRLHVDIPEADYRRFFTLAGCLKELQARLAPPPG